MRDELTYPMLVVRQRPEGTWGWRLYSTPQEIIASDGNQAYENERAAWDAANRIVSGEFNDVATYRRPLIAPVNDEVVERAPAAAWEALHLAVSQGAGNEG